MRTFRIREGLFLRIVQPQTAYIYAMDRIIYFYVTKERHGQSCSTPDKSPCKVCRYRRRDYELVRVGLEPWLVKRWEALGTQWETVIAAEPGNKTKYGPKTGTAEKTGSGQAQEKARFGRMRHICHRWFDGISHARQKKYMQRALEEEGIFWRQQFEMTVALIKRTEENTEEDYERTFACEETLEKLLKPVENCFSPAGDIWLQMWKVPEFNDYRKLRWVEHLLQYAALSHFLVLGYHPALPKLLCLYADKMKSLKWILPEWCYSEELQEFLENFYEEYGLAAMVQVLPPGETCKRAHISCREPSNILDFSGEERIPTGDIARESIWLDMDSLEEKQRRMESRNTGIYYYSLKKEWKQPVLP